MKKILALAVLAGALSSCVITIDGGNPTPGSFAVTSFTTDFSNSGQTQFYVCGNKSTSVTVSFSWTGDLTEYALEFYGRENPSTVVRSPVSGFFSVSGRAGVSVANKTGVESFLFFSNPNDINDPANTIRPFENTVRTQAVVVTPVVNPLGATKVRIVGRDSLGNQFQKNIDGEILILTNQTVECQN